MNRIVRSRTVGFFLLVICVMAVSWRPFFASYLFPIDDHEIVTYLAYRREKSVLAMWTGVFDFSPMHAIPNTQHWRPLVWISRIVEAELYGANLFWYASARLANLLISAGLFTSALFLYLKSQSQRTATPAHVLGVCSAFFLVFLSSPLWTDVYGRHLAAERHLVLSMAVMALGFGITTSTGSSSTKTHGISVFLIGLTLLALSKENAIYLVPAFGVAALAGEPRQWRCLNRPQLAWVFCVISPLWLTACTSVVRTTINGGSLYVPYSGQVGFAEGRSILAQLPLNGYLLCSVLSLLICRISSSRLGSGNIPRMIAFIAGVLAAEHFFTRVVGVSAPRYEAIAFCLTLVSLALAAAVVRNGVAAQRSSLFFSLIFGCALVFAVSGFSKTHDHLEWFRREGRVWNAEVSRIAESARYLEAEVLLIVVDPPSEYESGRVEKTYSLIKFLDWQLEKTVEFEIALQELGDSQRFHRPSFANLRNVADSGARLNGNVVIRPYVGPTDERRLCVLYSSSGRQSPTVDSCLRVIRFTL